MRSYQTAVLRAVIPVVVICVSINVGWTAVLEVVTPACGTRPLESNLKCDPMCKQPTDAAMLGCRACATGHGTYALAACLQCVRMAILTTVCHYNILAEQLRGCRPVRQAHW